MSINFAYGAVTKKKKEYKFMKGSQLIKIKIKIPSSQMVMSTSKLVKEKKIYKITKHIRLFNV